MTNKLYCLNENYSTTRLVYKMLNDEFLMLNGKVKEELKFKINNSKFKIQNSKLVGSPEDKFETLLFLPEGKGRKGEGGLRTKGYFKFSYENLIMNDECLILNDKYGNKFELDKNTLNNSTFNIKNSTLNQLPLITIVTVVYNGEKYLEETIQSVINQTYPNVEYIIIDGGSTDGTLDIIKKYEDYIDYWVSERDKGIYDAMNKGIFLSSHNSYLVWINAGDSLNDLNDFIEVYDKNIDVYFFSVLQQNENNNLKKWHINNNISKIDEKNIIHPAIHHQGFVVKKNSIEELYSLELGLFADCFFMASFINKKIVKFIKYKYIAIYSLDGISDFVNLEKIQSYYKLIKKLHLNTFLVIFFNLQDIIKILIKFILPNKIIKYIRKFRDK